MNPPPPHLPPTTATLRAWAEIDLAALRHNADVARLHAGEHCSLMAVVKADAYGHGLSTVVRALADRVSSFGVANAREALAAAELAPEHDIHLLGPVLPQEYPLLASDRFIVAVSSVAEAESLHRFGRPVRVHLCVDTGMGRMGCLPDDLPAFAAAAARFPNLRVEGLCSHFPSADGDAAFTREQIGRFRRLLEEFPSLPVIHLGNSAGLLDFSADLPFTTLARPGLLLYGLCPTGAHQAKLRPVLSLRSRVTLVRMLPAGHGVSYGRTYIAERPVRVATVGIGYGDGYPRHLSNRGAEVLLHGTRCPVLGRVTMDQTMIDVTHLPQIPEPGDTVTLIGEDGARRILATEVAVWAETIPWEILTGLTGRVERVTRDGLS